MVPSVPLASAPVMEHHHPILSTLGGHGGQVKIYRLTPKYIHPRADLKINHRSRLHQYHTKIFTKTYFVKA